MNCASCDKEITFCIQPRKRFCSKVCADRDFKQRQRKSAQEKLKTLKEATPCADCGGRFPSFCMDFDHKNDGTKLENVSYLVSKGIWANVEAEISKCDLVCANCHRIRTHAEIKEFKQNPDRIRHLNRRRF